jgi:hypothetical protein
MVRPSIARDHAAGDIGIGPHQLLIVEELGDVGGNARQHRRQQDGQLAEQDQRGGADIMQLGRFGLILGQYPRLVFVDVLVGDIGDLHDLAQRLAEFAVLEVGGDAGLAFNALGRHQRALDPALRALGQRRRQFAVEFLGDEAGAARGDVDVLADQVGIYAGDEVFAGEVQVLDLGVQLEGDVVTQPFRVHAQVQVAQRRDAGAARLGHFLVVDGQVAVHVDLQLVDHRMVGEFQHRRPEQQVERDDVLADEVDLFGVRVFQEGVEIDALLAEVVFQRSQVADRRVQPDIEELARRVRNRNAEVGRVARDIPVGQLLRRIRPAIR